MATKQTGNNGSGNGMRNTSVTAGVSLGWPTERWVGALIIGALGILILIRFGFKGIGVSGSATAGVNL